MLSCDVFAIDDHVPASQKNKFVINIFAAQGFSCLNIALVVLFNITYLHHQQSYDDWNVFYVMNQMNALFALPLHTMFQPVCQYL